MMHSRPNPGQVSASMTKLIGVGLFRFDGKLSQSTLERFHHREPF
jgi:hypothetical protein